ncbi:MAG TPA: carboxypeptidase-like regulatory domain-containing protein, partial [Chitinophagaceae bacterium]|nr:carboxypeptidase-like regulatory domain-containing protein [Chitinophagaceae bacterium]
MKRLLFTLTALCGFVILGFTQTAKLNGKILNKKNEPVVGASIQIDGSNTGTNSDVDGNFSLSLSVGKKYTLIISSVNYETKTISDVEAVNGQTNELQVVLDESTKNTLSDVVVKATSSSARKETAAALIQFQKNTNTVASVISAEAIRRSPDKNTGDVLKRIPGASVQEGKYL